ncbi:MAG: aspartate/glutamate racemase family protein [Steroidobacteraceae bacterium]
MTTRSVAVLGSGTASAVLPVTIQRLDDEDVHPVIVNPRLAVFAFTPYERLLVDLAYVDAAEIASARGHGAILVNSFADYGLEAMRARLAIPAIGAGEAAIALAAQGGRRFGIVTVWPASLQHLYDERLARVPGAHQCTEVRHVFDERELARLRSADGVMQRMQHADKAVIDAIVAACDESLASAGSECIVLGCTCMTSIAAEVAGRIDAPLIDPVATGYLKARDAALHGTVREPPAGSSDASVGALIDAWLAAGTPTGNAADCPVCILPSD